MYLQLALQYLNLCCQDWTHPQVSSVGAGIDSFLEYALKWYIMSGVYKELFEYNDPEYCILLGDHEFLDVWNESYAAIMRYSRSLDGLWVSLPLLVWAVDLMYCSIDRYT